MLHRDVSLGAVRRDAYDGRAEVVRGPDVVHDADAGQHEYRDLCSGRGVDGDPNQLTLVGSAEAVCERGTAEAVAVGHLDDRHAGVVERGDDRAHVVLHELVADRMRPVAQCGVGQPDVDIRREAHGDTPSSVRAISSPTRVAAAVMMSRFPAYGGR